MTAVPLVRRAPRARALWTMPFRPFFLAASLWSALALALWIGLFATGATLPSRFDPLAWHIHAMLFGFVFAAVAGFLLTAIANWTGRPPIRGAALKYLFGLWLLGRIACLVSAWLPAWLAPALDVAFPFVLCAAAAREIVAARNWRNLMMPVPVAALGVADLLMHLESIGAATPAGLGWRLGVAAIISLLTAVGGRIIPAFTRNWLTKLGAPALPGSSRWFDRIALTTLHAGLLVWAFLPRSEAIGGLLIVAALLNLVRLARWRGTSTIAEPLLAILHVGYLWVVVGAALLGASLLTVAIPEAAAIHAFTAGAIGTMVAAVMTRVSLGHTGRPLAADATTILIYLSIVLAGIVRIAAEFAGLSSMILFEVSAVLWFAGFVGFAFAYGPMLLGPRADEGRRAA